MAWKLFRLTAAGELAPLFINKRLRLVPGQWYKAELHPTKGYAVRQGWHVCPEPVAPHLSTRGRVWRQVEIEDFYAFDRPAAQGGTWFLAQKMRVIP